MKETNQTNLKEAYTIARHEVHLPLEDLLETISGLLKMKGKAYLVHRPDRLTDILSEARNHRLEAKTRAICLSKRRQRKQHRPHRTNEGRTSWWP